MIHCNSGQSTPVGDIQLTIITFFDWKTSSGWLESWKGLLFATDILTACGEAIFRVTSKSVERLSLKSVVSLISAEPQFQGPIFTDMAFINLQTSIGEPEEVLWESLKYSLADRSWSWDYAESWKLQSMHFLRASLICNNETNEMNFVPFGKSL